MKNKTLAEGLKVSQQDHSAPFFFSLLLSFLFIIHRLLCKVYYVKDIMFLQNTNKHQNPRVPVAIQGMGGYNTKYIYKNTTRFIYK